MPPKKKNAPKNAFYYYMIDFQRNGRFTGGLREVADLAGVSWKRLTPEQKRPYEEKATREKGRSGNHDKYTTQGQSYAELDLEQQEATNKDLLMKKTIKDTLISLGRNTGLATAPWFFIHINYFVKRETDCSYYAAEFAVSKYSIKDGVHPKIYSCMVDPGDLPTGYNYKAKLHSEETHKCPLPPRVLPGAKVGVEIINNLEAYIKENIGPDDEEVPPLYTLKNCMGAVSNILNEWALKKGSNANHYRVFELEELFYQMKNFALKPEGERLCIGGVQDDGFAYYSFAERALNNDMYSFTLNISCAYHEEQDVMNHCSKSLVRHWGWIMSNHLCRNLDIQMRPVLHCPRDVVPESLLMSAQQRSTTANVAVNHVEPIKTRAAGRGVPIVRDSSSAAAGPRRLPSAPQHNPWGGAHAHLPVAQFEDAEPQRPTQLASVDKVLPLRPPKRASLAVEIGKVHGGATFNAEEFPPIGRLNLGLGMGRGSRPPQPQPPPAYSSDDDDADEPADVGQGWSTIAARRGGF